MLHQQIKDEIKIAMKAKDSVKLAVVRGLSSALTNELVAKSRKPDELLNDEETLTVIKRAARQRQDSIEQFKAGGRDDLVANETAEMVILQTYLPAQMSREEIIKIAETKKTELKVTDKTKAGILIGAIIKASGGTADGAVVKEVVDNLF
ncbi:MAG: GatB/YqeY domain-containing protein [Candidatus Vogelbacteria bacterium]|nr:GatB/YqeY domain-containing protein [Candidatus Vogelbacteria bacterium]